MNILRLAGEVGGLQFNAAQVRAFLDSAAGAPVRIVIASHGGCSATSCAVYGMLRDYEQVSTVIQFAGSAALAPALAAPRREILAGGSLFFHPGWFATVGTAADLERSAKRLRDCDRLDAEIYAKASGQSVTAVLELMDRNTLLNAAQAVSLGFAHKVLDEAGGETRPQQTWDLTAASVISSSMSGLVDQSPAARQSRAEGVYRAVMLTPYPVPPASHATPAESAELRSRTLPLFGRLARRLQAVTLGVAPDPRRSPLTASWRCTICGQINFSPPGRDGRPTLCQNHIGHESI